MHCSTFGIGEVKMPSGTMDKPTIQDNRDGTVSINYEPREEGLHELHVKYNSEHVQGKLKLIVELLWLKYSINKFP